MRALDAFGLTDRFLRMRRHVAAPWLVSFCYHRIAEPALTAGVDGALADATPAGFDAQIGFLARHFRFISLSELVSFCQGRGSLPPNPALVTFDDGYKECVTTALPILERHGARASFFIPTMYLSERKIFWWDRNGLVIARTKVEKIRLGYPKEIEIDPRCAGAVRTLNDLVKTTRGLDLGRYFDELERAADVVLSAGEESRLANEMLMSWDEVAALASAGMDIGSHTHSHRVLQTLLPKSYDRELAGSRRELQERLGRPVDVLAYPVGYGLAGDKALRTAVRDAGYEVGLTCRSGGMRVTGRPDALDVPRILMDISYDAQLFPGFASMPALAPRTTVDV